MVAVGIAGTLLPSAQETEEMGEMEESEAEIWNVQIATGFSDSCKHWLVGEGDGSCFY